MGLLGVASDGIAGDAPRAAGLLELEAAYVVNFLRFTQWPADRQPQHGELYVVTVLGPSREATAVTALLKQAATTTGDHPLRVELANVPGPPSDAQAAMLAERLNSSHVVFDPAPQSAWAPWLAAIARDQPLLTVGVGETFADAGGMISLLQQDGRLVFTADPEAIRHSGLIVSSKVLRLARPLHPAR